MEKTKSKRGKIAEIFRKMNVGDTVFFPIGEYNPSTIRSAPVSILYKEYAEGWRWKTKFDPFGKRIAVTRIM
jgi:hypothetical protein